MACLEWCFLGVVPYARALALQLRLREAIREGRRDLLLLLEHPAVITLGRSASKAFIEADEAELRRLGIDIVRASRGGQVTLHAPGQLVGYPLRRLTARAVRAHVIGVIEGVRRYLLRGYRLTSTWEEDNPGLWCNQGKIAAVGVDARGGVATHGFALNLTVDLSLFELIVPCGLRRPVTSLERELGLGRAPTPSEAAPAVAASLAESFGVEAVPLAPTAVKELLP
ncbi:MAG: lipoyl(octanoyl) transferase [Proteobacteria bacterium]|nr:MAG: lipoyl(octanoyl) transferase [Pseudomonadota bacterium]PIE19821.1 MAG: lipoyl(octanoyl) transferase [Pseudomonadota bacterium]